jgi:hemerythrin
MALVYIEQLEDMDVEEMQQTHENEIKILNELEKLSFGFERKTVELSELEEKLDQYVEHVKNHFANEERLMEEYDFPSYEMHKMTHDMFLLDLNSAVRQWKQCGDIKKIINFVYKTPEWIVMHVNSVDTPTANFLARKMESSASEND